MYILFRLSLTAKSVADCGGLYCGTHAVKRCRTMVLILFWSPWFPWSQAFSQQEGRWMYLAFAVTKYRSAAAYGRKHVFRCPGRRARWDRMAHIMVSERRDTEKGQDKVQP